MRRPASLLQESRNSFPESHVMFLNTPPAPMLVPSKGSQAVAPGGKWHSEMTFSSLDSPAILPCVTKAIMDKESAETPVLHSD